MQEPSSLSGNAPQKKSPRRGCLIAAIVIVVLVVLAAAIGGILIFRFTRSEAGQKAIGLARSVAEGAKAPGMAELREMGCDQAFVLEKGDMIESGVLSGGKATEGSKAPAFLVVCRAVSMDPPPACEAVAETYVRSLGGIAPHPFSVTVIRDFGKDPECFVQYSTFEIPEK